MNNDMQKYIKTLIFYIFAVIMIGKDRIIKLYEDTFGRKVDCVEKINSGGSSRKYYRLYGQNGSVIGTVGNSILENKAFIYLTGKFIERGLNTPSIINVSHDNVAYLQEDLKGISLFEYLTEIPDEKRYGEENRRLLHRIIDDLITFQYSDKHSHIDFEKCYPVAEMDEIAIMWDLNYFKYCFLKAVGLEIEEPKLEKEFRNIASHCKAKEDDGFMYRDFQSRNILIDNDLIPSYIDFQGGRKGNGLYDLVSFLWQSRIGYPEALKNELVSHYYERIKEFTNCTRERFDNDLQYFLLLRSLQTLGAYGLRGITERKELFKRSIYKTLLSLVQSPSVALRKMTYLREIICRCEEMFRPSEEKSLTVTVGSFAYKSGFPEDTSGNGGGFIFDCRALHNPGRYDEYKQLTGRDIQVKEFIEKESTTEPFLNNIYGLIDNSVEEYLRRGFTSLSVWTGCTGGRHRSVYFADKIADHLHGKFDVRIKLIHREQGIEEIIEKK